MSGSIVSRKPGLSVLERPKFGPGMLLQHDDLDLLTTYTRELNRLMFRSLFGCGVVCGLIVTTKKDNCGRATAGVGAGLGLTCAGDPLYLHSDVDLIIDDTCQPDLEGPLWVLLCSNVKHCAPRTSLCPSDEDEVSSVATRERLGWEIRIVKTLPSCACHCDPPKDYDPGPEKQHTSECQCAYPKRPCYVDHYDGKCGCQCDDCDHDGCDCIVLAKLTKGTGDGQWFADHSVRRFIRPVLIRDPQPARDIKPTASVQSAIQGRRAGTAVRGTRTTTPPPSTPDPSGP